MNSINEQISRAFQRDVCEMMLVQFEEHATVIQDPITMEETLHKVSGEEISETEYFALKFFELGWNMALESLEEMGTTYLDSAVEEQYPEKGEENDDAGRSD